MAMMVPAECDLQRRPTSERIVFAALRQHLSAEWIVFHAFDYVTRDQQRKRWDGEIDFLLYHPKRGFLVIEVKGGAISCNAGQWYQDGRRIDPVAQAKRNKYAVRKFLEEALGHPIPLKFAHAVCFPSCSGHAVWPAEAQELVLTGDALIDVESFAEKVLLDTQIPALPPIPVTREEVLQVLAPVFEYGTSLAERIHVEEPQFFLLTEQQCAILDALEQFPRLLVRGCAGSGKTILAVRKAQRLAAQGKSVLLLCYNQLLATRLQQAVREFPKITAAPFFEYCIKLLKIPEEQVGQYRSNPKLYTDVLPKLLEQHVYRTCLEYDAVIVDEGQDFTAEAWKAIALLPGAEGAFYIFYDEEQNIFNAELKLPKFDCPPVELHKNCRNTRKIFEALKPFHQLPSDCFENAPQGTDVQFLKGDCRANLLLELERLVAQEGIAPHEIVILGAHRMDHTSIGSDPELGRFHVVEHEAAVGAMEIAYFTYMKFKGCEKKVVILLDVDDADPRWSSPNALYTAMSRAVHHLIVLRKSTDQSA